MTYSIANSPVQRFPDIGDQATSYKSYRYNANSGETISDVRASGFFTNGGSPTTGENSTGSNLYMVVGDEVLVYLTTGALYYNVVSAVNSTTGAATIVAATFA